MKAGWRNIGAAALLLAVAACQSESPRKAEANGSRHAEAAHSQSKTGSGEDWSTRDLSFIGASSDAPADTSRYDATRAACARVIDAEPPAADLPTRAERAALEGCSSEALYYGIGMRADPVRARKCAMIERERKQDRPPFDFFYGEAMLMMVYANGSGAARDMDVAIHMACRLDDAPAAMDGRIRDLDDLRRTKRKTSDFESCEHNTSGIGSGICADHFERLAAQERDHRIAVLKRRWTEPQRALFDRAYASFGAYADIAHEMNCFRGTGQAQCAIDGRRIDVERFLKRMEAIAQGTTPPKGEPYDMAVRPAVDDAGWKERVEGMDAEEHGFFESNRREAIAARVKFERDVIAFMRVAFPNFSSRQVRVLFRDL